MSNVIIRRLLRGTDLKEYIINLVNEEKINAGVIISSVGSLQEVNIRCSDLSVFHCKSKYEILSLNGTISMDRIHLHISIANDKGKAFGGHLLNGCIIDTTCELVIQVLEAKFTSEYDDATGFNELKIK